MASQRSSPAESPKERPVYPSLQPSAFSILNPPENPPETPADDPPGNPSGNPPDNPPNTSPEDSQLRSQETAQADPQANPQEHPGQKPKERSKAKETILQLRKYCLVKKQLWIAPRTVFRVQWTGCRTELSSSGSIMASRRDQDWGPSEFRLAFKNLISMTNIAGQVYETEGSRVGDDPAPTATEFLKAIQAGRTRAGTPMPSVGTSSAVPIPPVGASSAVPVPPPGASSATSISPAGASSAMPASMPSAESPFLAPSFTVGRSLDQPAASSSGAPGQAASPAGSVASLPASPSSSTDSAMPFSPSSSSIVSAKSMSSVHSFTSMASLSSPGSATSTRPTSQGTTSTRPTSRSATSRRLTWRDDIDVGETSPLIPVFTDEEHAKKWAAKMSMKTRQQCKIYEISTLLYCKTGGAMIPITEKLLTALKIVVKNEIIASRLFGGWKLTADEVMTYACVGKVPSATIIAEFDWGVFVPEAHGLWRKDSDEDMPDAKPSKSDEKQ